MRGARGMRWGLGLTTLLALGACLRAPRPVEFDRASACGRLATSYPSEHGLVVFADTIATEARIPWCFPAVGGAGTLGFAFHVPVPRAGRVTITLAEVRPATRFHLRAIDGGCRDDNTGRTEVGLGDGTSWVLDAHAGRYCLSLYKLDHRDADAWTTLTVVRP